MSLSELRWARGFFRLWIVLTIIWVVGTSWLAWEYYPRESDYYYLYVGGSGQTYTISQMVAGAEKARAANSESAAAELQKIADERRGRLAKEQSDARWIFLYTTIVAPLAVLVLGCGIAWAMRGFFSSIQPSRKL